MSSDQLPQENVLESNLHDIISHIETLPLPSSYSNNNGAILCLCEGACTCEADSFDPSPNTLQENNEDDSQSQGSDCEGRDFDHLLRNGVEKVLSLWYQGKEQCCPKQCFSAVGKEAVMSQLDAFQSLEKSEQRLIILGRFLESLSAGEQPRLSFSFVTREKKYKI